MRITLPNGKKVLVLVREGDYAHPGENAAIDLVMGDFAPDREPLIPDVGIGRGGHYLQVWTLGADAYLMEIMTLFR